MDWRRSHPNSGLSLPHAGCFRVSPGGYTALDKMVLIVNKLETWIFVLCVHADIPGGINLCGICSIFFNLGGVMI